MIKFSDNVSQMVQKYLTGKISEDCFIQKAADGKHTATLRCGKSVSAYNPMLLVHKIQDAITKNQLRKENE